MASITRTSTVPSAARHAGIRALVGYAATPQPTRPIRPLMTSSAPTAVNPLMANMWACRLTQSLARVIARGVHAGATRNDAKGTSSSHIITRLKPTTSSTVIVVEYLGHGQDGHVVRGWSEVEGSAEVLDATPDVLQAASSAGVSWVNPHRRLRCAHGNYPCS